MNCKFKMETENKIEESFIKFSKKLRDELTRKEEDFLLELWREENE